jgi:hypothetical protein
MGAIDELERDATIRVLLPDHLQHQKLIKIRIEQRAHDRVDAERVIIDARGEIGDHGARLGGEIRADKARA